VTPEQHVALALLGAALGGSACHDLSPAVATANATREVGHATAAQLRELCTVPYERAAEMPLAEAGREVIRLDRLGCPRAARAHDALRAAHRTLVGVITAIDAGQCDSVVSRRPAECDLAGAVREVIDASAEMALAVDALRGDP
jgi:hypothetical protein